MSSRQSSPAPPVADRPRRLQEWWLGRSVRAKGLIVVAVPLIALIVTTSASLALQYNERQERSVALAASALSSAANPRSSPAPGASSGCSEWSVISVWHFRSM